jgi:rhamnulokinase
VTRPLRSALWLLSETLRSWELQGETLSLTGLIAMAADVPAGGPTFDPDKPQFMPPGNMPARIAEACRTGGQRPPQTRPEIVRCILDSLAVTFAARVHDAQRLSGQRVDVIHIVGGGSQNRLLCQLVADAAGLPVVAGPVEATALGNLLVQARTHGALTGDLTDLRAELRAATQTRTFSPHVNSVTSLTGG